MSVHRVRHRWGAGGAGVALIALAAVCVVPRATQVLEAQAVAPQAPPDWTGPSLRRLFDATEPLERTLKSDFGAVAKERGTEKKGQPGVLSYAATPGDSVVLDVHLRTRGHFRLANCQYPPLKVGLDKAQTPHTIFAHESSSLKLTVQCRGGQSYANYLLEEYLIYRAYNLLTDRSFRARLARVTYVDATGKNPPETRHAFFVEDDDRMARRNHMKLFVRKGVTQGELDFEQTGLAMVFQYMIGNTDFAVTALHNIVLIQDSVGIVYPVPYDFDWSGIISTPYAFPDSRLPISTVRHRLWSGP